MSKKILHGQESRDAILAGVNIIADAVKVTLGPRGRNVVIEKRFGAPAITKDGVTVAREIELADPVQNIGAQMLRQVALKTSDTAGDGTTTATVLAQAIYVKGLELVKQGANPMALKRGIDKAVITVVGTRSVHPISPSKVIYEGGALNELSVPVSGKMVAQIGTISSNGDESVGKMIADAMERVGDDGIISVEESQTMDSELVVVEGMQFERGYVSPYLVTDPLKMQAELINPYVFITSKTLATEGDIVPILETAKKKGNGRPLLIIAPDVTGYALEICIFNVLRKAIQCCVIKAPGFGPQQVETLHDIAAVVGGTVIASELGIKMSAVGLEKFGVAKKIIITKDTTTIMQSDDDVDGEVEARVAARVEIVRSLIESTKAEFEKTKLQERLAKLVGGVAVIKVGAPTELEMKELKDRVEDAMHATRAAVEEGIVPGGGVALLRCRATVKFFYNHLDEDELAGARLVHDALSCPIWQIAKNAGDEADLITTKVGECTTENYGYDAASGKFLDDMVSAGIVDPTKVTRHALINAASIAGMMLTTEAMISEIPLESPGGPPPGMAMY